LTRRKVCNIALSEERNIGCLRPKWGAHFLASGMASDQESANVNGHCQSLYSVVIAGTASLGDTRAEASKFLFRKITRFEGLFLVTMSAIWRNLPWKCIGRVDVIETVVFIQLPPRRIVRSLPAYPLYQYRWMTESLRISPQWSDPLELKQ
jgi:hypothetical protein